LHLYYTLLFFGGLEPLCGIGVVSFIESILNPLACKALKAVSLPEPGPFNLTVKVFKPCSWALLAACSAAICAA
jgi:hypothetical protein